MILSLYGKKNCHNMDSIYEKIWNVDMEKKSIYVIFAQLCLCLISTTGLRKSFIDFLGH